MLIEICPLRQSILDATGPVLVTGGPGSGKTTIALVKALRRIDEGLLPGQSVLFLSFSRAAVGRVAEASKQHLPHVARGNLAIHTFHSFFWEILNAHGYLLGCPRGLRLLGPHDEKALKHEHEEGGDDWSAETERLFATEGLTAFDLFAPKARALLTSSKRLRSLYAQRHPLIIVDEAQDTAEDQWQCVQLLAESSQLICLADLDQQIFDFRPGVSDQRVTEIMEALTPLRVDLLAENHRSPNSEIVAFGNDMLLITPRGSPYRGVSRFTFNPQADRRDVGIRRAVALAYEGARAVAPKNCVESLAVLATRNRGVRVISRALVGNGNNKAIAHHVVIDEAPVLLASRFIAFLMEPRRPIEEEQLDLADALDLIAQVYRAQGGQTSLNQARALAAAAIRARAGQAHRSNSVAARLVGVLRTRTASPLTGDARKDWFESRRLLRESGSNPLISVAKFADQLFAFQRGKRISQALTDAWQTFGAYKEGRKALDAAIVEEQLLSGLTEPNGIQVMTVHKSKGKEFDGVVLFDERNSSPLNFCQEDHPQPRSRRLVRVAITRAKHHLLVLTSAYDSSELLEGHQL